MTKFPFNLSSERRYAEDSRTFIAGMKTEDELLQRIWNQADVALRACDEIETLIEQRRLLELQQLSLTEAVMDANTPNGEQTREQLLERLALTVKEAIDGGSFNGTLFEYQVSGTLWLLYGEQRAHERQH